MDILCETCGIIYPELFQNEHFNSTIHNELFETFFVQTESAARCRLVTYVAGNVHDYYDVEEYLESLRENFVYLLRYFLQIHDSIKFNAFLECRFHKDNNLELRAFKTANQPVFSNSDLHEIYTSIVKKLINEIQDQEDRGSGWNLYSIVRLELRINRYEPISGGLRRRIKLPPFTRKSCVNPFRFYTTSVINHCCKNICFKLAVLGQVLHDRRIDIHNVSNYLKLKNNIYDWSGITFPVKLDDIPKFEQNNDISINVYGVNERLQRIFPMKVVSQRKRDHRDILFYKNHYSWIKNFSALVSRQILKKKKAKLYVCRRCFKHFYKRHELEDHEYIDYCVMNNSIIEQNTGFLKFKNYNHQLQIPYVIYLKLNFELQKTQTCIPSMDTSFLHPLGIYVPTGYQYTVLNKNTEIKTKVSDTINDLIESLARECRIIRLKYKRNYPPHSYQPHPPFVPGLLCHICECPITSDPVLDHDHLLETDNIRGYAHNKCNLNFRLPQFVPVVTEDLSKKNGTTLLKEIMRYQYRVAVVPYRQDVDRFLTINVFLNGKFKIRFIDQCQMFPGIRGMNTFEHIRSICFERYKLDMYYYATMGSFSFDAMLKKTNVSLELIDDPEMHKMLSSNIRGGLVTTLQNHSKGEYIYYFDVIGLYSKIMLDFPLPVDGYEWVQDPQNLLTADIKNDDAYILEVDLQYPTDCDHVIPLCPEFIGGRLKAIRRDKTNYVIHHQLLKLVLSMGMILKKVHRAVKFRESHWLRDYIKSNIQLRDKYNDNKPISDYFKCLSNIIYGKCCERVENRLNVHLLNSDPSKLMKLVKQSSFIDRSIVNEDHYSVYTRKRKVKINKPYSVAFAILDLAKAYMYHKLYVQMQMRLPKFDVIYHDTDCYVVKFKENPTDWLNKCDDIFHFGPGLGQVGKFRDKCEGNPIVEFIIVTNKVYSYSCANKYTHVGRNLPVDFNLEIYNKITEAINREKICRTYDRKINNQWYAVMVNKNVPCPNNITCI